MLPLWLSAIPFAIAYSTAAQKAGLNPVEIQLMSLTISSAAAQIAIVQLLMVGAAPVTLLLTAVVMSLHHVLYGLSLAKRMKLSRRDQITTAYFLTDAAYGLTIAGQSYENPSFLLGTELSMFFVWNLFTAVGVLLNQLITIPPSIHLDFVAPLTFFILLLSLIKTCWAIRVVIITAVITLVCYQLQLGGATIFIAGVSGAFVGALWADHHKQSSGPMGRSISS